MRRRIWVVCLLFGGSLVWGQFAGGSGTEADPWQITTAAHLDNVRNYLGYWNPPKYFKLMNDIDLSGYDPYELGYVSWQPIGNSSSSFRGVFDGDGHVITNLTIDPETPWDYQGLFGHVTSSMGIGGTIKNLGLESGSITGTNKIGALVGYLSDGNVINCYSNCSVTGESNVGGLIGLSSSSTITGNYATGTVFAWTEVGGLIGYAYGYDNITLNYATGNVYGWSSVGGLIGLMENSSTVQKNYAIGNVQTYSSSVGNEYFGGFVGRIWGPYGLIALEDNYASGNVTGVPGSSQYIGGFIGQNYQGSLTNCYSTGTVSGNSDVGGFCGGETVGGNYNVSSCYWDTQTSVQESSVSGTGKTTTQMKTASTFSGWNFSTVWSIVSGGRSYPYLTNIVQDPPPGYVLAFSGGDGSSGSPWEIEDAAQLNLVRNYVGSAHTDKYFKLIDNVDLSAYLAEGGAGYDAWGASGWPPIGTDWNDPFRGNFNGNGKTITGLSINRSGTSYVGLFGWLGSGAVISDLGFESVSITGNFATGSLAGVHSGSTISGCYASGTVSGAGNVGGLVGTNNTTMTLCYADVNVSGPNGLGGLAGENAGTLTYSYATGNVSGSGGGSYDIGGLAGSNMWGTVTSCYATGSCSGYEKIGGLIGTNSGSITDCYAVGGVSGTQNLGGLVGSDNGGTMTRSYWNISTSGQPTSAGSSAEFGKTTDEMKQQSTFVSWDFTDTWTTSAGTGAISYPYLQDNIQSPAPGFIQYFADGAGTSPSPWEIETISHLNNVRSFLGDDHSDKYFILNNDIDLTAYLLADGNNDGALWEPIGDNTDQFKGHFNGNKFKVTGLQINRPASDNVGLFAYIGSGATISNLGVEVVESASVSGNDHVGSLAGQNHGSIEKCYVGGAGMVTGNQSVGSLFGLNNGNVSETYTNTAVSGVLEAGGFTGKNTGTINNAFSTGAVSRISGESEDFGGFCGLSDGSTIQRCYSSGSVTYDGTSDPDNKGFLGSASGSNSFSVNYFDLTSSGQTNATQAVPAAANARTSAQMRQQATFSGWNFSSVWGILEGQIRPFLSWEWEGVTLDGLIPVRSMSYNSGTYSASIDMNDDEIPDINVSFTAGDGSPETSLSFKYAEDSNISSVQLFVNPEDIGAYYRFEFDNDDVMTNGLSYDLDLPYIPNDIWYRQPDGEWQVVPSYSGGFGKKAAPGSVSYTIDATQLTYDESGSGVIEFASDNGGDMALPIRLRDFSAVCHNGSILLTWQTASETENAAFRIYRDDEMIAEVEGAGTTTEPKSYSWRDNYVIPGRTYRYVLADVDLQGKETKHPEIEVEVKVEDLGLDYTIGNAYPNPFNPVALVPLNLAKDAPVRAVLYDVRGYVVKELINCDLAAGSHALKINGEGLSTGIYILRVAVNDAMHVQKIALMK